MNLPILDLIAGNINDSDQSKNKIDIADYNVLISCSIFSQDNKAACKQNSNFESWSDLNDDGLVDNKDYTLWLTEFINQEGAVLPEDAED